MISIWNNVTSHMEQIVALVSFTDVIWCSTKGKAYFIDSSYKTKMFGEEGKKQRERSVRLHMYEQRGRG